MNEAHDCDLDKRHASEALWVREDPENAQRLEAMRCATGYPEFEEYPKTPRLFKEIIITEKLDGTNAQVFITDAGEVFAGSRSRWITPKEDNYGFARWVEGNKTELLKLGPGRHFGEWWGNGIQRTYGMKEKVFSLFNVGRWMKAIEELSAPAVLEAFPACCRLVPVIFQGEFSALSLHQAEICLRLEGSKAAPGFMRPEGLVIFHTAARCVFKVLFEGDNRPKSAQ